MNIEIKQLGPNLVGDYLEYFKNTAFSDHMEWAGCCCLHFHWDKQLDTAHKEFVKTAAKGDCSFSWSYAEKYVMNGIIQGYLAYHDNLVVGWCNANDKLNYAVLKQNVKPEIWCEEDAKVKAIVCFSVAPNMRGKGVASKLLQRVCADAKEQKYDYIEAYPRVGNQDVYVNHHGPESLYSKQGFTLYKEFNGQAVVRKYL